jgi:2-(1,2-epoxy-1,2-dihydrophenyl)acetyl-CoA isomerase
MSLVDLEFHEKSVALVRLGRPDSLCAIDEAHTIDLMTAVEELGRDPEVRSVVITGRGRAFCAGGDLRWASTYEGADSGEPLRQLTKLFHITIVELRRMPKPVVAAVNGIAAGGGLSLALSGDFRVAARSASFMSAYLGAGITPDGGLTWLLPRVVGRQVAARLILRGDHMGADDALACGLVDDVVDDDELIAASLALATKLAEWPGEVAGAAKRLLDTAWTATFEAHLEEERASVVALGRSPAHREALDRFLRRPS